VIEIKEFLVFLSIPPAHLIGYFGEVKMFKNVETAFESVTSAKPAAFKHSALRVEGTAVIT
jgi:hypothetical protein